MQGETTGERIRRARKAAGLTQAELADKIGVKFSAIHKYESGAVVNLKRETIAALAAALNVKPSWLMCMEDEQAPSDNQPEDVMLLVSLFEKLSPEGRRLVIAQLRGIVQSQGDQDVP